MKPQQGTDAGGVTERWLRLDADRTDPARPAVPAYPFDPPDRADMPAHLYPPKAQAALAAPAIMAEEWHSEPAPVRSRPTRDALLADARLLLDRYGPGAHYWTNATAADSDPAPDFLTAGLQGTESHRFHTAAYIAGLDIFEDLGVIAVNDKEVGVFWSFGATDNHYAIVVEPGIECMRMRPLRIRERPPDRRTVRRSTAVRHSKQTAISPGDHRRWSRPASQAVAAWGVEQQEQSRRGGPGEAGSGHGGKAPTPALRRRTDGLPGAVGEQAAEQPGPRDGEAWTRGPAQVDDQNQAAEHGAGEQAEDHLGDGFSHCVDQEVADVFGCPAYPHGTPPPSRPKAPAGPDREDHRRAETVAEVPLSGPVRENGQQCGVVLHRVPPSRKS